MDYARETTLARRRRAAILDEARKKMRRLLVEKRKNRSLPDPAPRYDEIFHEGTLQLDREAALCDP